MGFSDTEAGRADAQAVALAVLQADVEEYLAEDGLSNESWSSADEGIEEVRSEGGSDAELVSTTGSERGEDEEDVALYQPPTRFRLPPLATTEPLFPLNFPSYRPSYQRQRLEARLHIENREREYERFRRFEVWGDTRSADEMFGPVWSVEMWSVEEMEARWRSYTRGIELGQYGEP